MASPWHPSASPWDPHGTPVHRRGIPMVLQSIPVVYALPFSAPRCHSLGTLRHLHDIPMASQCAPMASPQGIPIASAWHPGSPPGNPHAVPVASQCTPMASPWHPSGPAWHPHGTSVRQHFCFVKSTWLSHSFRLVKQCPPYTQKCK
jgi:hypothetical protein